MSNWDFAGDPVARALLALLLEAGVDGERIDELPENLREIDVLDLMDGAKLIEFGTRKHCRDGTGRLLLENGYQWQHWAGRQSCLPLEMFLPDLLRREAELRPLVRLTAVGRHEAKILKRRSMVPADGLDTKSRTLFWDGVIYQLPPIPFAIVEVLYKAYQSGHPNVALDELRDKVDANSLDESLAKAFQRRKGGKKYTDPVLDVIETVGQGVYRLADPKKT